MLLCINNFVHLTRNQININCFLCVYVRMSKSPELPAGCLLFYSTEVKCFIKVLNYGNFYYSLRFFLKPQQIVLLLRMHLPGFEIMSVNVGVNTKLDRVILSANFQCSFSVISTAKGNENHITFVT